MSRAPASTGDTSRPPRAAAARFSARDLGDRSSSGAGGEGVRSRTRHELDRAAARLRERFAARPARRALGEGAWLWGDERARGCEASIRELLGDIALGGTGARRLEQRAQPVLERAAELLARGGDVSPVVDADRGDGPPHMCEWCGGPIPEGKRPETRFCKKVCRQAASRARLKGQPARSPSPPPESCSWCGGPMPEGLRPEARFCKKACRQASSRFDLAVKRSLRPCSGPSGPGGTSTAASSSPASAARRRARAMRFAYADPPYPGHGDDYPEGQEVDHHELVDRLGREFPDGWALSTSAEALQDVLALCPLGVRVCSWHRSVRYTRSRRALSAWELLIVCGGRELPTGDTQTVTDALSYGGRFRAFPGAIVGMKAPQYAVWMFAQLGARPGDQLVDVFPGSGAVGEAWRRYSGQPALPLPAAGQVLRCPTCFGSSEPCAVCVAAAGNPAPEEFVHGAAVEQVRRCGCGRVYGAYHAGRALCFLMQPPGRRQVEKCVRCGERLTARSTSDCTCGLCGGVDARHVAAQAKIAPSARSYDLAMVCREQAMVCPVNGARCESAACIDVGCTAADTSDVDAERAA